MSGLRDYTSFGRYGSVSNAQDTSASNSEGGGGFNADYASAGINAAAQTANAIMASIAASTARQRQMEQAGMDRDASTSLAKMRVAAQAEMSDKERRVQAQQFLLSMLNNAGSNTLATYDNKHAANKMGSSLISAAYARR